jgi:hypothetical protein
MIKAIQPTPKAIVEHKGNQKTGFQTLDFEADALRNPIMHIATPIKDPITKRIVAVVPAVMDVISSSYPENFS